MNYQDFELEVRPLGGREYELVIIRSPAGEGRERAILPFSELQLKNHLLNVEVAMLRSGNVRRMALTEEEQAVQDFGQALFDFLFPAELRSAYRTSLNHVHAVGDGLRVKLRLNDPKLAFLPWEFLFDSNRREYVCLSTETPLVRYLEIQRSIPPLKVAPPLRILGMVVNPKNYPHQLDVVKEKQRVEEAVKELQAAGLVELHWLEGQTWRDLQRELHRGPWHIFHFIGHGAFDTARDEGRLIFANNQGNADPFGARNLALLLAGHKPLRLALLNACDGAKGGTEIFSGTAPILVTQGVPAVLAMQYAITDSGAIEFARAFYESLADGYPVDAAVGESRRAMRFAFEQTVEWGVPVLYMRSRDGVLFELQESVAQTENFPTVVDEPELPIELKELFGELEEDGVSSESLEPNIDLTDSAQPQSGLIFPEPAYNEPQWVPVQLSIWQRLPLWVWGVIGVAVFVGVMGFRSVWGGGGGEVDVAATQTAEAGIATNEPTAFVPQSVYGIEWIEIPAGSFMMGAAEGDTDAAEDELPLYEVTLETFWIAKTEVTNEQYKTFVDATGYDPPDCVWEGNTVPDGLEDHPVVCVNWLDAVAYTEWLSEETGLAITLPSEAEWEKAARGDEDTRIYPWGDNFDGSRLNCGSTDCPNDGFETTAPVGSFPSGASPYGVLDMSGNVWEWTRSIYVDYPYKPDDGRENLDSIDVRVLRGGSFGNDRVRVRVSNRFRLNIVNRFSSYGFRVVVRPPSQP